ncbi:MAG: hypothetical protein UR31_C0007G0019 [Parcubacteria group bacterium GW2011_GWA2_33_14]|uniref:Uncharacterized protein n=1 Tax=Candidatus Staskawiczbacteria bacterium RIFCSPHIGHO2_02_FULL_33_16 TaxID=1802204 RepID=A0A1G2HYJ3_9BACT|nr:MAG: hypothetical protein UR31_C0007G0019 [Parcubacteria group bacterium GW2011_GWA2_33_14]OGZ67479.1 MAG: hypothetical protein A3D34_01165 [Candidatus Staskawiczbacteria bacterium RIFCSPHIGHO2_02_FULL_33_16]OGZ70993.1 MAG: hypothetical protein A2980_03230 [Candidatus Staskawiczbacteria bacterium RIFCSPLOWO2_01_FULL_33_13]
MPDSREGISSKAEKSKDGLIDSLISAANQASPRVQEKIIKEIIPRLNQCNGDAHTREEFGSIIVGIPISGRKDFSNYEDYGSMVKEKFPDLKERIEKKRNKEYPGWEKEELKEYNDLLDNVYQTVYLSEN